MMANQPKMKIGDQRFKACCAVFGEEHCRELAEKTEAMEKAFSLGGDRLAGKTKSTADAFFPAKREQTEALPSSAAEKYFTTPTGVKSNPFFAADAVKIALAWKVTKQRQQAEGFASLFGGTDNG